MVNSFPTPPTLNYTRGIGGVVLYVEVAAPTWWEGAFCVPSCVPSKGQALPGGPWCELLIENTLWGGVYSLALHWFGALVAPGGWASSSGGIALSSWWLGGAL